jgi:RHS repeat-associated protein
VGWQHNLVAYEAGGLRYFPVLDARNEVIGLTDPAGQWAWRAEMRAFGEAAVSASSAIAFPLRPSGQVYDPETGLHYNTARYYDPAVGRYIQTDPLLELSGERNLYGFAWNNPLAYEDRYGWLPSAKGTWECTSPFSPSSWKDAGCSGGGKVDFPITPWVKLSVSLKVNSNFRDCCDKDGNVILKGKGCLEVQLSGSASVGFDPIAALLRKVAGMANTSMAAAHIMPEDDYKSPVAVEFIKITLAGSCNFCGECGDFLTSPTNFDRCCLGLTVDGPSASISLGAFKVSVSLFKIDVGKVCFGPYGWDFLPPGFKGPGGKGGFGK